MQISLPPEMLPTTQVPAEGLPYIWLLDAELDDDGTYLTRTRLCNAPRTIPFGGRIYEGAPFGISPVSLDDEGSLVTTSIVFSNATREASRFVSMGRGLAGRKATITLTHERLLAADKFMLRSEHRLGTVTITDEAVVVPLNDPQLMQEVFPIDRFIRDRCTYATFGDPVQCIYQGTTHTSCPRTLVACGVRGDDEVANNRVRQHPGRFGAYPGLATQRL